MARVLYHDFVVKYTIIIQNMRENAPDKYLTTKTRRTGEPDRSKQRRTGAKERNTPSARNRCSLIFIGVYLWFKIARNAFPTDVHTLRAQNRMTIRLSRHRIVYNTDYLHRRHKHLVHTMSIGCTVFLQIFDRLAGIDSKSISPHGFP